MTVALFDGRFRARFRWLVRRTNWPTRQIGRKVAVDSWNESGGDLAKAEAIAREKLKAANPAGFDPSTLILIMKIILLLFEIWQMLQVVSATTERMQGEPDYLAE